MPYCDKCDKMFASRQSLWKHRQRKHAVKKENNIAHKEKFLADIMNNVTQRTSKDNAIEDGLQETSGNGLIIRPRIGSEPAHKEKLTADIINNVTQRGKDQGSTSILPKERVNSVLPKVLSDLPLKLDSQTDSASDSEPVASDAETDSASDSNSEASDADISEDIEFMPDNPKELKAAFRNLYRKVHNNTENYNKLVLMLDELRRMKCLTREECNGVKDHLQKKIGIA